MSLQDGLAAFNLEFSSRVPRSEYSADMHYDLVSRVTGLDVSPQSDDAAKKAAACAFQKAWNYDFLWNTMVGSSFLQGRRSRMGHAQYAAGGTDFDAEVCEAFDDPDEVLNLDIYELYGSVDRRALTLRFEENYKQRVADNGDAVNMTGIYITCVSGLIDMLGWDALLTAAGTDPAAFGALTDRYVGWIGQHFEALAEADVPHVMIHDDIVWTQGPFISPEWYRKYVFPNYKKLFSPILESGKKLIFTSDGNYSQFIDDIAGCGVHGFVMEPLTDMAYVAERYGKTHIFIGNADTRILLSGTREEIFSEVKRCMDIGKPYPGFFMAVGNHIPPNTPVENAMYYNECYEKLSRR